MKELLNEKKRTILIVCGFVISLIIISFCVSYYSKRDNTIKLTIVKNAYSYLSTYDEVDELVLPIFINNKNNNYLIKENINNASITDEEEENILKLNVQSIEKYNYETIINNEKFYCYLYKFNILNNSKNDSDININKAYLKLDYNNEVVKINIGSLSSKKILSFNENNNIISITNLKGIINDVKYQNQNRKDILAIAIGIKNNSNNNIIIKSIKPLDCNYKESLNEIKVLKELPSSNGNINDILGYDYKYNDITEEEIKGDFLINKNEKEILLLPLKKISAYCSNCFGLEIEFVFEGKEDEIYKVYVDDFLFYTTKNIYEEFDILTYENY